MQNQSDELAYLTARLAEERADNSNLTAQVTALKQQVG